MTAKQLGRLHRLLSKVNHQGLLVTVNVLLGLVASAWGLLHLGAADRIAATPAFSTVGQQAFLWGVFFFGSGLLVVCTSVLKVEKSVFPISIMGLTFLAYSVFSGLPVFQGISIGLVSTAALGFALLSAVGCIFSAVPSIAEYVESVSKEAA